MRPIDKGKSPYQKIKHYSEALPYLEKRIGLYCSYCEMRLSHVPEVEHVVSKSKDGAWTDWNNLLLGCKYCNSRKKNLITQENENDFLWPAQWNTAVAYFYQNGVPQIAEAKLNALDATGEAYKKAERLFALVQLDHFPTNKEKDRRFQERIEAHEMALQSLERWKRVKKSVAETVRYDFLKQILETVKAKGFFSVWMEIFIDEPEVLRELVQLIPGTKKEYFDENGRIREILKVKCI